MAYVRIPLLGTQETTLELRFCSAASFVENYCFISSAKMFCKAIAAVNEKFSDARIERADILWNIDNVLSKLNRLRTDFEDFLNDVWDTTTAGFLVTLKQNKTEVFKLQQHFCRAQV